MKQHQMSYLLLVSLVSAMGGFLFGYDWVVIGGAKIFYEPFFGLIDSPAMSGWAMSSALVGCLFGALLSGAWSDRYGRKKMLIIASVLFSLSAYGTGVVDSFDWFVIYRIVGGLGIGIASNISPVYIAEIAPSDVRGRFVSINQLTIVLGILAAQIVNWRIGVFYPAVGNSLSPEGVAWAWRWMFWAELIPALLFFILSFFIPESPRWLALNGKSESARTIFRKIGGADYANQSLLEIGSSADANHKSDLRAALRPGVRRILLIGIVLAVFQQWCGINVIFNYAQEIFVAAGYGVSDVLMNIVITGITNLVFTFVAIFTVDRLGRRALLLFGAGGLALIYLLMGGAYFFNITGIALLIIVVLAIACYAMSLAPVMWVVISEIFPNAVRGTAMAIATFALWAACFVLTYTFPIMNQALGAAGTFWIYGLICILGFVFIYKNIPETKNRSLEQIEKDFLITDKSDE